MCTNGSFLFSDVYLALMHSAIDNAVPEYFETLGMSASDIPPYAIKLWASVMVPGFIFHILECVNSMPHYDIM